MRIESINVMKTLSPGARFAMSYIYMATRDTKTDKTIRYINFLISQGLSSTDNILNEEIDHELYSATLIDSNGLTALGATWAKHFGTERMLPNDTKLPANTLLGLSTVNSTKLAELINSALVILAYRSIEQNHSASKTLFDRAINKVSELDIQQFATEY